MHPNPIYHTKTEDQNLAFASERAFGALAVNGPDGPLVSHVPFTLAPDGKSLTLHLVRSNPIARGLADPRPAVIAISGPDSYVSPDWYGVEDQVPTWNYAAVHLRGRLIGLPPDDLGTVLAELSAQFEARLLPKQPWTMDKMTPDVLLRMMRMIVPARMEIDTVDGTWKLNQNKSDAARVGAATGIRAARLGQETDALADLMMAVLDDDRSKGSDQ